MLIFFPKNHSQSNNVSSNFLSFQISSLVFQNHLLVILFSSLLDSGVAVASMYYPSLKDLQAGDTLSGITLSLLFFSKEFYHVKRKNILYSFPSILWQGQIDAWYYQIFCLDVWCLNLINHLILYYGDNHIWDLRGTRIKPLSPALAFWTTREVLALYFLI